VKAYQERVSDDLWRGSRLDEQAMIDLFRKIKFVKEFVR